MDFKNKLVLITGAAAGIGKQLATLALKNGANLIIWDIDQDSINSTITELSPLGKITGYKVDISKNENVEEIASLVKANHAPVDILINCAGILVGKHFHEHTTTDILRTMEINSIGPMLVTKQFLPVMMERNAGHICNIASSAGYISNPKMSLYAASKWAVIGWSDSLRIEMQRLKKNIQVTTVTPYFVNTGMIVGASSKVLPILTPENVAKKVIHGIKKNRIIVSMPLSMHFIRLLQALLPIRMFDLIVGKGLGVYSTMDNCAGKPYKLN